MFWWAYYLNISWILIKYSSPLHEKITGWGSCVSCSLAEEPASLRKIFLPHRSFCICKRGILKESQVYGWPWESHLLSLQARSPEKQLWHPLMIHSVPINPLRFWNRRELVFILSWCLQKMCQWQSALPTGFTLIQSLPHAAVGLFFVTLAWTKSSALALGSFEYPQASLCYLGA